MNAHKTDDKIVILTIHGKGESAEFVSINTFKTPRAAHLYITGATVETEEADGPWVRCEMIEEFRKYPLCRKETYFEDLFGTEIFRLDDRSLQILMQELDSGDLAKALMGMEPEIKNKFYRNMTKDSVSALKEDMEYMGPISKSKRIKAQEKILNKFEELVEEGRIIYPTGLDPLVVES